MKKQNSPKSPPEKAKKISNDAAKPASNDASGKPSASAKLLVLHGPNLNLLGVREPAHYGMTSLAEIDLALAARASKAGVALESFQSNHEGVLIDRVHAAQREGVRYLILNPAAYTHTSVALRDALLASAIPFVEVHLSNVHAREPFRQHSYFSDKAIGVISGFGGEGYLLALEYLLTQLGLPGALSKLNHESTL
ncbi:MAG: type II 3-dehydroquinate dehydratase [Pseudomonadota bacterium]